MPATQPQTRSAPDEPRDPILKLLEGEPHRAFTAEDLVRTLTPALAKDPQKLQQAALDVTERVRKIQEGGRIGEISDGLFKARLFFDKEQYIEHAFIGGMGNTRYRFRAPVFRFNIGVLSLFFVKDKRAGDWVVTVRDTTIGKDYGLVQRLRDGTYTFGSRPTESGEGSHLQIEGKYIGKTHMSVTIAGDEVAVEDHNTLNGTRIDHLTSEGQARYKELAEAFLRATTDPKDQVDSVKRGRFALERLLQHHENFETSFFSAVVDSLLIERGKRP